MLLSGNMMMMILIVIPLLEWNQLHWVFYFPWVLKAEHKTFQDAEDLSLCCPLPCLPVSAPLSFNSFVNDRCFKFREHCYSWERFLSQHFSLSISSLCFLYTAFCANRTLLVISLLSIVTNC